MMSLLIFAAYIPSTPDLGKAAGQCRPNEQGSAFVVSVGGLKDRRGTLKLELYPDNDEDFLADDNVLVMAGKPFRRVEAPVPASGPVQLCIRAPGPGTYTLSVLHDRDANRKFGLSVDGIGFPGNPKIGWSKPKADKASASVGTAPAQINIVMNYRKGLFSFGPIHKK